MSKKVEGSMVPQLGTDKTGGCDLEISQSSSKLPAFFPHKTKCTLAPFDTKDFCTPRLVPISDGGGASRPDPRQVCLALGA